MESWRHPIKTFTFPRQTRKASVTHPTEQSTECLAFPTWKMGLVLPLTFYWHCPEWYLEALRNIKIDLLMAWVSWSSHGFGILEKNQQKSRLTKCCLDLSHCAIQYNKPSSFSFLLKQTYPSVCTQNWEEFLRTRI